jgi:hypothetical protein
MRNSNPANPMNPAEGRNDLDLPGADRGGPAGGPGDRPIDRPVPGRDDHGNPEAERRDELAQRVGSGTPSPAGRDRPDVLPDVEVPDEQA